MILGAFNVKYMPQTSIKGQVLADLVAEFTESQLKEEGESKAQEENQLRLMSLKKISIEKSLRLGFSATNNEAEYKALLVGMAMVQKIGGRAVEVFSDSRLVVGQVNGELEARDLRMQEYLSQAKHLQSGFKSFAL